MNLTGVTFQEALDRITFVNRLFYKVARPEHPDHRPRDAGQAAHYDEQVLRTFYLQNAEPKETLNLVKTALRHHQGRWPNKTLEAITMIGTPDEVALAERIVDSPTTRRGAR